MLISATRVMFWVCSTVIGIVDIVMFQLEEIFDRPFFMDIVLYNLKKKITQIPDLNPERPTFLAG
jgi:hypothetical protein